MNKVRKGFVIATSALASAIVTYFGFGLIATQIATDLFINKRYSDVSTLNDDFYRIQKVRTDFDSLKDREEISFPCRNETLKGYLYEVDNPKALLVYAHGVNNQADGNGAQIQDYFVRNGYDLFTIDMTGCGRSSGKGMKTLHESRYCVLNAIKTIKNIDKLKNLPIILMGHSWGAYGVVSATEDIKGITAVVSLSGYNKPNDMMYGFVETNASSALAFTKPAIDFSLSTYYHGVSFFEAETAIKHNPDLPYIVVHGSNDTIVPLKGYSIYDNVVRDNYHNVTTILLEEMTHGAPWKTLAAVKYMAGVEADLKNLRKEYKNKLPEEVREQYLQTVDKDKSSDVNLPFLNLLNEKLTSYL